jgi:hypothetical protein
MMKIYRPPKQKAHYIVIGFDLDENRKPHFNDHQSVPLRQPTLETAAREAKKLASRFPGRRFEVYKFKMSYHEDAVPEVAMVTMTGV